MLCELLLTFWSNLVGSCSPWRSWSRSAAFQFSTALHEPLHFTLANFDKYHPKIKIWKVVCMFFCLIWALGSLVISHTYMEVSLVWSWFWSAIFQISTELYDPCTLLRPILKNIILISWTKFSCFLTVIESNKFTFKLSQVLNRGYFKQDQVTAFLRRHKNWAQLFSMFWHY